MNRNQNNYSKKSEVPKIKSFNKKEGFIPPCLDRLSIIYILSFNPQKTFKFMKLNTVLNYIIFGRISIIKD